MALERAWHKVLRWLWVHASIYLGPQKRLYRYPLGDLWRGSLQEALHNTLRKDEHIYTYIHIDMYIYI